MCRDLVLARGVRKLLIGTSAMRRCWQGFMVLKKVGLRCDHMMKESQVKVAVLMKKEIIMKRRVRTKRIARS
jgi:urocanate hydratase